MPTFVRLLFQRLKLCIEFEKKWWFFGQRPLVPLLILGPPFFQIILFGSTTLLIAMTGISLHMQWPLTSQLHGSVSQREQLFFCYGANSMPMFYNIKIFRTPHFLGHFSPTVKFDKKMIGLHFGRFFALSPGRPGLHTFQGSCQKRVHFQPLFSHSHSRQDAKVPFI
jgi:hypothetical protein